MSAIETIKIHQTALIDDMIDRFNLTSPRSVPASCATDLRAKMEEKGGHGTHRQLVGCLMRATSMAWPDMTKVVREVARQCHDPPAAHWLAAFNILRYLTRTQDFEFGFEMSHGIDLEVNSDSDCARNKGNSRSVPGSTAPRGTSSPS